MAENCGFSTSHIQDLIDPSIPLSPQSAPRYVARPDGWFGWSVWANVDVDLPQEVGAYRKLERVAGPFWRRSTAQGLVDSLESAYRLGRYSFEIRLSGTVLELDAGVPVG